MNNNSHLLFARWCASQVAEWDRQDERIVWALAQAQHESPVDAAKIAMKRNQVVLDKAREMGIVES